MRIIKSVVFLWMCCSISGFFITASGSAKEQNYKMAFSNQDMLIADGGAVSCKTKEAAQAGLEMLQKGGNAVDAIVATGLAMAVTSTGSNSLGGYGGAMVIYLKDAPEPVVVDFTTRAPLAATPDMFSSREEIMGDSILTVSTWNAVAGLYTALERYGTMKWKDVIQPAIRLAEEGFVLAAGSASSIRAGHRSKFQQSEASMAVYTRPEGGPYQEGDLFVQKDLANSLRILAEKGPDAIYTGELAKKMVDYVQSQGGILAMEDLVNWRERHVRILKPAHTHYRGYDIYTSPILTGGENLIEILNILKGFDLPKMGYSAEAIHLIIETYKLAWADRLWYAADPWAEKVPYNGIMSQEYADERRKLIDPKIAWPYARPGDPWKYEDKSSRADAMNKGESIGEIHPIVRELYHQYSNDTATYSTVDKHGNMAALTKTMRNNFGSGFTVPGTGITLNNGMGLFLDDLDSKINSIKGGKLALNNMNAFIILKDGKPYITGGGSGGRRIMTECAEMIINVLDWNMSIQEAVNKPRFHIEYKEPCSLEAAFPYGIGKALEEMGHKFTVGRSWGRVHAVLIDQETGKLHVARDNRSDVSYAAGLISKKE